MPLPLLSCFNPRRDQTNIVYSGQMAEINHFSDLAEVQILIALHEHDLFLPGRENLRQFGFNICPVEGGLVDLVCRSTRTIRDDLNHDRAVVRLVLCLFLGG